MMVDEIVQSKKDTPSKHLCLEMLFRCSLFRLKEPIKVKKVKLRPVPLGGGGGRECQKVDQSDDAKRREKGDGLMLKKLFLLSIKNQLVSSSLNHAEPSSRSAHGRC